MTMRKVGAARKKTAKKKTAKRKTHRRISGVNDISGKLMRAGGLMTGAVAGRELNTILVKMFPTLSPMVSAAIQIGAGYFLPKVVKGAFIQNMGDGMMANGGMVLVVSTGIISGVNDRQAYQIRRMNGTGNLPVVAGPGRQRMIAGTGNLPVVSGPTSRIQNLMPGTPGNIPTLSY